MGPVSKKGFFETYRFSEDLDFTVLRDDPFDEKSVAAHLLAVSEWLHERTGLLFPGDGISVEAYENPRGQVSLQAKMTYVGPLRLRSDARQRVKFDLSQDELVVDETDRRALFHPYTDALDPTPKVRTYSVNEVLAEKSRALYQRQARARDVYDLVHVSRNFRDLIDPEIVRHVAREKFLYKDLPVPTIEVILSRIDADVLRANWNQQLGHQLPVLPPVDDFIADLRDALAWWLEPDEAVAIPPPVPRKPEERTVPREPFRAASSAARGSPERAMDQIRYAARNRLLVEVTYKGVRRIVEPYSLRYPGTGNTLLYVHERTRGQFRTDQLKALNVSRIENAAVLDASFTPRYRVEL